jgi:hypothetical protein
MAATHTSPAERARAEAKKAEAAATTLKAAAKGGGKTVDFGTMTYYDEKVAPILTREAMSDAYRRLEGYWVDTKTSHGTRTLEAPPTPGTPRYGKTTDPLTADIRDLTDAVGALQREVRALRERLELVDSSVLNIERRLNRAD